MILLFRPAMTQPHWWEGPWDATRFVEKQALMATVGYQMKVRASGRLCALAALRCLCAFTLPSASVLRICVRALASAAYAVSEQLAVRGDTSGCSGTACGLPPPACMHIWPNVHVCVRRQDFAGGCLPVGFLIHHIVSFVGIGVNLVSSGGAGLAAVLVLVAEMGR